MHARLTCLLALLPATLLPATQSYAQAELEAAGQATNNTRSTAQVIAPSAFVVNTSPTVFGSLPTATIVGRSGMNDVDFFRFSAPAGIAYFDIDGAAAGFDSYLALFDSTGTLLADNDDSFPADAGSASDLDAFLGQISLAGGTYFLAVAASPNAANATFTGLDPIELFRPDGIFGGFAFPGANAGVDSFAMSGPQAAAQDGFGYSLAITIVPAPGIGALLAAAPLVLRRRRR